MKKTNYGAERIGPIDAFVTRCHELSIPVWSVENGDVCAQSTWRDIHGWFECAPLLLSLREAFETDVVTELFPGAWVISLHATDNAQNERHAIALLLSSDALDTDELAAMCVEASLDVSDLREKLLPIATHAQPENDLASLLRWSFHDLLHSENHTHAVQNLSKQLVESYEQMGMLYHVAESMHCLEEPRRFVEMTCGMLLETLGFDWVAVRFSSLTTLGRGLANELVIAGAIPCSHTRYDKLAGELQSSGFDHPVVLDTESHRLAELVQSEVFANPLMCDHKLAGFLLAGNKQGEDPDISSVDMQLLSATADYLSAFMHNSAMYNEQRTMFLGVVKALSASIDAKDRYTRGHSERVAHLASQLVSAMGMDDQQAERVRIAGLLHDVGKIGVPEGVLLKPGRLTDAEFDMIKRHPTIGYNILKDIEPLEDVLPGVLYHHERFDGKGYPHGLKGGDIPIIGRILAVADAFDAMSSDRAYRPRIAREKVRLEMRNGAGTQWDAELIRIFLGLDLSKYDAMIERHAAQDAKAA